MTMQQLLDDAVRRLEDAGVPDALLDARYLLMEVFDLNLASFLTGRDRELAADEETAEKRGRFQELIEKRAKRIPLQQLLGVQEFMGLEFYVNEHVLIPRQDTETLVELVLKEQKEKNISVLDMCTGSGCIAVSLARLGGFEHVTAADISEEALKVAKRNAGKLLEGCDGQLELVHSDMFAEFEDSRFDVIVSNPPYIPTEVIRGLEPEVRDHEPMMALDGTEDGLKFYRILAEESGRHLRDGGSVYMEIGYDQSEAVEQLFREQGCQDIVTVKDMAGLDRVVRAVWKKGEKYV